MRWENLFDDLAGQLEHELDAEEVDVRGEEERLRIGRLTVRDRLVALHEATNSTEYRLRVHLDDGRQLSVGLRSLGRDWLMGDLADERGASVQCLLPFASIASLTLDPQLVERSTEATGPLRLADRLGLTFVLRDLARRRRALELHMSFGVLHGTIDRVGRDHVDLAEHEVGSPRRRNEVSGIRMLPLTGLRWIRL
ncbi:MAG TPA: hypothetical protein PK781_03790 [Terrimesophilobacter sp.]|nr:hypothetical protein [Terrimesophilobacter sp.]HRP99565.1 hypothetical protein [Terrimesophilobacter sp.]